MVKTIRLLALDIDGVLTDGRVSPGPRVQKRICFHDLDAVNAAKRAGLTIALVTGENDKMVDTIARRFGITLVRRGAKQKLPAIVSIAEELDIGLDEICYVGDSDRDAPALEKVGLGLAPANATPAAKNATHRVLLRSGGDGVAAEAVRLVLRLNDDAAHNSLLLEKLRHAFGRAKKSQQPQLLKLLPFLTQMTAQFRHALLTGRKILVFGDKTKSRIIADGLSANATKTGAAWSVLFLGDTVSTSTRDYPTKASARLLLQQLKIWARSGDVVVGLFANKMPPSIGTAFALARRIEAETIHLSASPALLRTICPLVFHAVSAPLPQRRPPTV